MACGQRCKEIIDQIHFLNATLQCMATSILRNQMAGLDGLTEQEAVDIRRQANHLAQYSQQVATRLESEIGSKF